MHDNIVASCHFRSSIGVSAPSLSLLDCEKQSLALAQYVALREVDDADHVVPVFGRKARQDERPQRLLARRVQHKPSLVHCARDAPVRDKEEEDKAHQILLFPGVSAKVFVHTNLQFG